MSVPHSQWSVTAADWLMDSPTKPTQVCLSPEKHVTHSLTHSRPPSHRHTHTNTITHTHTHTHTPHTKHVTQTHTHHQPHRKIHPQTPTHHSPPPWTQPRAAHTPHIQTH